MRDVPIYLVGTLHLGPPGGYFLGQAFADVFVKATTVVCEVGPNDKAFDTSLLQRQSGSLAADVGPALYARFRADSRYEPSLETVCPAGVILNLAVRAYSNIGLTQDNGLDATLERDALLWGKSCGGFETFTDQLTAILAIDKAAMMRALEVAITEPGLMLEMRDLIIRSFVDGDEAGIREARNLTTKWSPSMAAKILSEREERWLPRLQSLARRGDHAIVAVGALHLSGPDGLVSRLNASGMPIERVIVS